MHLWRFTSRFLKVFYGTEEKFQLVFTINVRDIYIPVVYYREQLLFKKCECYVRCICLFFFITAVKS